MSKKLIVIFLIAFFIRLINLNQSLWLDEATTARVVQKYSFFEILNKFSITDFHPPLYYLFIKLWTNLFGYSEVSLRFPSILFCLLAGYVVYLLGKKIRDENDGIWVAAFFLFNPLIVYYSQEARMYMMATFLLTGSIYYFSKINQLEVGSRKGKSGMVGVLLLFSLSTILALSTFYGSVFLIAALFFHLIYKRKFQLLFLLLFTVTVTFVLLSPLLYHQLINAKSQLNLVPNWPTVLGTANLKNLLLIPLKFSIGRISFDPKWIYWGVSGIWTMIIFFLVLRGGLRNKFLAYLFLAPIILGVLLSFFTPLLQYFRFLYLIPLVSLLIALGSYELQLKAMPAGRQDVRWVIMVGFLVWSALYIANPSFHREDWKSLAQTLPNNSDIYMIASSSDPVKYYRKDIKIVDLKSLPKKINKDQLYVVPYTASIHGVDYVKILEEKKFKLAEKTSFRELTLESWNR